MRRAPTAGSSREAAREHLHSANIDKTPRPAAGSRFDGILADRRKKSAAKDDF